MAEGRVADRGTTGGAGGAVDEPDWDTGRLEAFSDGVLAIAITLLVLEIRLPEADEAGRLGRALRELWPSYAAYALTFLIIGIMWAQHHGLFRLVQRADQGLLLVNVVLLGVISFLPFPSAVLADALRHGDDHDERSALLFYGGCMVATALAFNLLWHYVRVRGLLHPDLHADVERRITRDYVFGPVLYLAAALLAFVGPAPAMLAWAGLALFFLRGAPRPRLTRGGND